MTNRELAALETRRKLLDAAKKIVCEKGMAHTSVAEITKSCGVACGTFYTHFKRKEDIIDALSREMYQEMFEQAKAYDGPFMARLVFFMTHFSSYIEKSGLKLCQEWVRNTVDPDLVDDGEDKPKVYVDIDAVTGFILDGIERGEVKKDAPIAVLAHTLVDVLYGQMLCWDMSGGAYSLEGRTKEFCRTFLPSLMTPYLA